jgi:LacI family gluconate utilization system Gnt-I transcriptional repressor
MADVARHAGVSTMTVSRALKNKAQVSCPREKIFRAVSDRIRPRSSGGQPVIPQKASSRRLFRDQQLELFRYCARITDELERTGLQLLLGYTDYSGTMKLIEAMLRRRPEKFILTGGVHTPHTRRMRVRQASR